jgi:hypothetical protein
VFRLLSACSMEISNKQFRLEHVSIIKSRIFSSMDSANIKRATTYDWQENQADYRTRIFHDSPM